MKSAPIKVGFCVAYDWPLLQYAIPSIYDSSDVICLSIDKNRKSWSGNQLKIEEEKLWQFLKDVDPLQKIKIYEDNFSLSTLSPMENEVRQRNLIAEFLGKGGWHIQLDCDEYFINFHRFCEYLKKLNTSRPVNVTCPWYTLFKTVTSGYLFISNSGAEKQEYIPVATNCPSYEFGRRNSYFNIKTDFFIVHQSWARSETEVLQKIENWGHNRDFDVLTYFQYWRKLNELNYKEYKNFHPIDPESWESLEYVKAASIEELLQQLKVVQPLVIPSSFLKKENSIWLSRFRSIIKNWL